MEKDSAKRYHEAIHYIPGGVNSPVRAFQSVGAMPLFISRASGSRIYDIDGREYIDFISSWGPMILGHAHPVVVAAIADAAGRGTSYGISTELEVEMARLIVEAIPSIDMVRMVSSGTEATMSAIRLARGYTGREKILKFEGCYHGHSDSLLVKAGSGIATLGIAGSPGVPQTLAALTITLPYNDSAAVASAMEKYGDEIACVIVEPVAGNMGVVPPNPGFLEMLRTLTLHHGSVLIFDEVITGFRVTYGGFQNLIGIEPDLTCLGKIIGGGLPVGAFGGRREIMEQLAPTGPVYQAGTLSGNPLAMAAGAATLNLLKDKGGYEDLEARTARFCNELDRLLTEKAVPHRINRVGSMFTVFFTGREVVDFPSATSCDTAVFARYFKNLLANGVCIAPSQFESSFLSLAHSEEDMHQALAACDRALRDL